MNPCPWCGATAVDMTTSDDLYSDDRRTRYLCTGPESHEYREGDGPDPEEPESEPLIVLAKY